jgi:glycosyltransferase EpsF
MIQEKTRVLYICPGKFGLGGVQITIMQLARQLTPQNVSMDVVVFSEEEGFYEEEFKKYGKIFRIPLKKAKSKLGKIIEPYNQLWTIYIGIKEILKKEKPYQAIHAAYLFMSAPCIMAAKQCGVPVRITHSHVNRPEEKYPLYIRWYNSLYDSICRRIIVHNSTVGLGVTKGSIEYLFGNMPNTHVIRNPVIDKNKFDIEKYEIKSRDYIQLIQVGNFSERKNPIFSVEVLEFLQKKGLKCKLILLGQDNHEGMPYRKKLEQHISQRKLEHDIFFLPADSNVAEAMANSDIMMIPSLQEGLPNVALEAQYIGLPCFLSDAITTETDCGLCNFYPLDLGAEYWADQILEYIAQHGVHKQKVDMSAYSLDTVCAEHLAIWQGKKYYYEV